jgi:hypothetical protein
MNNKKASNGSSSTSPLYETTGPAGEKIIFTPADLVEGMGHLKGKGGKKFKPSKYKSSSLSDRISSKDFGKTKSRE